MKQTTKIAITRWVLFVLVGFPTQAIVMILYPFAWAYWRLFIFKRVTSLAPSPHDPSPYAADPGAANRLFQGRRHLNDDDHGLFTQYGVLSEPDMTLFTNPVPLGPEKELDSQGKGLGRSQQRSQLYAALESNDSGFLRVLYPAARRNYVSGDCVVAWAFAVALHEETMQYHPGSPPAELIERRIEFAARHYLKYLGTLSANRDLVNEAAGLPTTTDIIGVSARCNNFGVNWCPDGTWGIGQPATGPQFYTSSALFALAAKYCGGKWRWIFWAHWVLLGGWYWAWAPVLYTKDNDLAYVRDITMKSLWVHLSVFGRAWWITQPMRFIAYQIATSRNALFFAMMGRSAEELPDATDPFFSQNLDGASHPGPLNNIWIKRGVRRILDLSSGYWR